MGFPLIALVGSPNVGKSTLFNRLTNSRRSITSPLRGVTRDAIKKDCTINGVNVTLVDTGGIKAETDEMDKIVKKRSLDTIKSADCILCLLDAKNVTGEDEEILASLRPLSDKVILVVNKIDSDEQEHLLWNFYSYGFERIVGISASHDRGITELKEHIVSYLAHSYIPKENESSENSLSEISIAILGRSNRGKSTLTNALLQDDISIVSDIPGTTRDTVSGKTECFGTSLNVIDTAGIRRKGKVEEDVEYYSVNRAIRTIDECDVAVLLLSSDEDVSDQDKKIAALIVDRQKPIVIAINKKDLWKINGAEEAYIERLRFLFPVLSYAPVVTLSALNESGLEDLIKKIKMVHRENNKRVSTSVFNEALTKWKNDYTPPRGKRGAYKILYGTQTSTSPLEFVVMVNRTEGFPENYISYIKNKIRSVLGFSHVPLTLTLKGRKGE